MLSRTYTEFVTEIGRKLAIKDQPIVLTDKQKQSVNNTISQKEPNPDMKKQQESLQELLSVIQKHNRTINQKYMNSIQSGFTDFPEIQNEIKEMALNGYSLIGYKGTNREVAENIISKGVSTEFQSGDFSGNSRGEGFYITPHFEQAVSYARAAVRKQAAYYAQPQREELQTPPDETQDILAIQFDEKCRVFEQTEECVDKMNILLCYVKDFFNMRMFTTVPVEKHEAEALFLRGHDCLEGEMMGWEFVFSPKKDIYDRILTKNMQYLSLEKKILPDLPAGKEAILKCFNKLSPKYATESENEKLFGKHI